MTHRELALDYFDRKFHCSQAVLAAICNDLLGCDVRTEEGVKYCFDNNLFTEFCPKMVANAVDVLEEIINEYEQYDD